MSLDAMHWVRRQHVEAGAGAKWLLFLIADRADESWTCFPSIELLEAETQLAPSTIRAHLRALEEQGLLTTERRRDSKGRLGGYRFRVNPSLKSSSGSTAEKLQVEKTSIRQERHVAKSGSATAEIQQSPTPPIKLNPQIEPKKDTGAETLDAIWAAGTRAMRRRSSRADVGRALKGAPVPPERILAALKRYVAEDEDVAADRGQPALHRWIEHCRYDSWLEDVVDQTHDDDWWRQAFACKGPWHPKWPPKSQAPPHILKELGLVDLFSGGGE